MLMGKYTSNLPAVCGFWLFCQTACDCSFNGDTMFGIDSSFCKYTSNLPAACDFQSEP